MDDLIAHFESPKRSHPLVDLLIRYYKEFEELRLGNEELSDLNFQKEFGLHINIPKHWDYIQAVKEVVSICKKNTVIIYPSTDVYKTVSGEFDNGGLSYFSWHELYVAMDQASSDARPLTRLKGLLLNADLTIFLGAPVGHPEITEQVRSFCPGCLIVLGV